MKKIIEVIIFVFLLLNAGISDSQVVIQSQCSNSDFSLQDFTNWTGCYCISHTSSCYTPIMYSGTIPNCTPLSTPPTITCGTTGFLTPTSSGIGILRPPLHTILTTANTSYYNASSPSQTGLYDSLTNYQLKKIPAGVNQVCRLNSWAVNYETSQLKYNINVDTNISGIYVYNYAAVLENPAHGCADQPYFQIRLLDSTDHLINDSCGVFTYVAGTPGAFVNVCTAGGHTINWFNWQTIGLSLKKYHGQTLKMQFIAADCGLGGHFGYAYLYSYCLPGQIKAVFSSDSSGINLSAPPGFRYKWLQTGDTTQSITVMYPTVDSVVYQVAIYSLANAFFSDTLQIVIKEKNTNADFATDISDNLNFKVFPNPFTDKTTFTYTLKENQFIRLVIFDLTGREIKLLCNGIQEKGTHNLIFDDNDIPSGTYYYKLKVGDQELTGKLLMTK